jgi:hypothetical protein
MRLSISPKLTLALAMLALFLGVTFPGCNQTEPCSGGET